MPHARELGGAPDLSLTDLEARAWAMSFDQPTLVMDLGRVAAHYHALAAGLGRAQIFYAIKANPHEAVLARLAAEGSAFDAASRGEIELCLRLGIPGSRISFGNTIKRASDIAFAHAAGITLFSADSAAEVEKIAANAPGSEVCIRMLAPETDADWPLTRKFGCTPERALELMDLCRARGLRASGISFHVGSQTREPAMWQPVLDAAAALWHAARRAGHDLDLLNIGGGFPATHDTAIPDPTTYAKTVMADVEARFGPVPRIMAEPGRAMVAEAGVIAAEVLLVDRKSDLDTHRWVYLDIGRFSGLAETEGEAIRYSFVTQRDHEPMGPCIIAGPSCDSVDVLYERRPVLLPMGLAPGDRVLIRNTGAYTSSYASVGFNGFPPLAVTTI
ncbi:MAG: type III PLP-dependent enzyme [Pseudomonadota bacterium]